MIRPAQERRGAPLVELTGIVLLLGVAAFAAVVLLGEPCRGVADNGDFFRVTRPAGIEPLEPPPRRPGLFVQCSYAVGSADLGELFTSAALFAWAARHVPFPAAPGTMALQQMGTLWLALWLLLVAALVRAGAPLPALVAVFVVLADPGYLLFWNSFYGDAALLFALAGSVALLSLWAAEPTRLARLPRDRWLAWVMVLVTLGFVGSWSKMQYLLFAAVLALALAPFLGAPPAARRRLAGATPSSPGSPRSPPSPTRPSPRSGSRSAFATCRAATSSAASPPTTRSTPSSPTCPASASSGSTPAIPERWRASPRGSRPRWRGCAPTPAATTRGRPSIPAGLSTTRPGALAACGTGSSARGRGSCGPSSRSLPWPAPPPPSGERPRRHARRRSSSCCCGFRARSSPSSSATASSPSSSTWSARGSPSTCCSPSA